MDKGRMCVLPKDLSIYTVGGSVRIELHCDDNYMARVLYEDLDAIIRSGDEIAISVPNFRRKGPCLKTNGERE